MPDSRMDESTTRLLANLDAIEAIARELPKVGKRSELKVKAEELLRLTEVVRREVAALDHERITGKFTPDLTKLWGGGK